MASLTMRYGYFDRISVRSNKLIAKSSNSNSDSTTGSTIGLNRRILQHEDKSKSLIKQEMITDQFRRPFQIPLSHQSPHPTVSRRIRHDEATITNMAAPTRIIRLDIKRPQAPTAPILVGALQRPHLMAITHIAKQHHRAEALKPVRAERR